MTLYDQLIELKDDAYREFQARLVQNIPQETILGVRTPELRKIAKEVFENHEREAFLNDLPHRYRIRQPQKRSGKTMRSFCPSSGNGLIRIMYIHPDSGSEC